MIFQIERIDPGQQLADAIEGVALPIPHLDRMDGVVPSNLLQCLAVNDRLHGVSSLQLLSAGASLLMSGSPLLGVVPPSEVTMGTVQKYQSTSAKIRVVGLEPHTEMLPNRI
jgi:hypothetical protein